MHPLEVLKKLRKLRTPKTRKNFLAKLPDDHPFWYCAQHVIDVYKVCFPFLIDIEDPHHYGQGAPADVFVRILASGETQLLDAYAMHKAVKAFSKKCTEEEWTEFYKPLLEGELFIPLSVVDFQEVAPKEYGFSRAPMRFDFQRTENLTRAVFPRAIEPYPDAQRAFWYMGETVAAFLPDGTRIVHPLMEKTRGVYEKTRMRLVLDLYMESEEIITVRDVFFVETFFNGVGNVALTLKDREEGLNQIVSVLWDIGITGADVIERYHVKDDDSIQTIRSNAQVFFEQGYNGVVMVERSGLILQDIPVLTLPTKKNVVTCLDIISGADEFENKTEYIIYRGMVGGKKVTGQIHYGLTWEQRDTYFKDRDNLIGKRLEILSCGTNEDGRIIMPVFQKWRD